LRRGTRARPGALCALLAPVGGVFPTIIVRWIWEELSSVRPSLRRVQGFLWKLPVLRGLSPVRKGLAEAACLVTGVSLMTAAGLGFVAPRPSDSLLRSLAEIGAALLIAYAIEISWLVRASRARPLAEREARLGVFVGLGAAGLLGIALALAIAEPASEHHWTRLDEIAFAWAIVSLGMLGLVVVLQPLITHEWLDETQATAGDGVES
jgi:hypothetical protein